MLSRLDFDDKPLSTNPPGRGMEDVEETGLIREIEVPFEEAVVLVVVEVVFGIEEIDFLIGRLVLFAAILLDPILLEVKFEGIDEG